MRLNIITENQVRIFAKQEVKKVQDAFWKELEKLRKRIVELEMKNMDANKKFKGTWRNQK